MKKTLIILFAVLATTSFFTSCEKIEDLNTVDFDATFSENLDLITAGTKSDFLAITFSESVEIDPKSNPDVEKYSKKIKAYDIDSVKVTITSMSQEDLTVTNAYVQVKNDGNEARWDFPSELLKTGKMIALDNVNGQWDTVSKILMDGQVFTVMVAGEADKTGVTFKAKFDIVTKVTAKAL